MVRVGRPVIEYTQLPSSLPIVGLCRMVFHLFAAACICFVDNSENRLGFPNDRSIKDTSSDYRRCWLYR